MGLSSARGTKNNRQEPGSFVEVVPRRALVAYDEKIVFIGKTVKGKSELLRTLH